MSGSFSFSPLRRGLIVIFVLLLLASLYLILHSQTINETSTFQTQTTLCTRNIVTRIPPLQTTEATCSISQNEWLTFSLTSTQSVPVVATILFNATGGAGEFLVFNQSNTAFSGVFPFGQNGSIVAKVYNPSNKFLSVTGLMTVYTEIEVPTTIPTTVYPFRLVGYGVLAFSVIAVFMLVWNPGRFATNILDRITLAWNRRQEKRQTESRKKKDQGGAKVPAQQEESRE